VKHQRKAAHPSTRSKKAILQEENTQRTRTNNFKRKRLPEKEREGGKSKEPNGKLAIKPPSQKKRVKKKKKGRHDRERGGQNKDPRREKVCSQESGGGPSREKH